VGGFQPKRVENQQKDGEINPIPFTVVFNILVILGISEKQGYLSLRVLTKQSSLAQSLIL
jgi:hypothetical protein